MPQASVLNTPIFCPVTATILTWFCLNIYKVEGEMRNAHIPKLDEKYARKAQPCASSWRKG